nr:protein enabled homolog [Aegilops tauschii subsp. strangulata]
MKPVGPCPLAQVGSELVATVPASRPTPALNPSPLTTFTLHRVPEDQVGASKEDVIQVRAMNEWLKEAYDASEALENNVRRACEIGTHYATLEKEVLQILVDLETEKHKSKHLAKEKNALGEKRSPPTAPGQATRPSRAATSVRQPSSGLPAQRPRTASRSFARSEPRSAAASLCRRQVGPTCRVRHRSPAGVPHAHAPPADAVLNPDASLALPLAQGDPPLYSLGPGPLFPQTHSARSPSQPPYELARVPNSDEIRRTAPHSTATLARRHHRRIRLAEPHHPVPPTTGAVAPHEAEPPPPFSSSPVTPPPR